MGITNQEYFFLFLASFIFVGFLTPLMRKIAIARDVVDRPNSPHKSHKKSVPYLGGVAIIIGIVSITYASSLISDFTQNTFWLATSVLGPAVILGLVGLIDDIRNLSPWPRFIAQSIIGGFTAILLVTTNNLITFTSVLIIDISITIFWVVGICNAINFFDNFDGGAASTIAISSAAIVYLAINSRQFFIAALSVVILGSILGFLIWNKNPAKIYMGDAGSLFLGVLMAVTIIRLKTNGDSSLNSILTPFFLMALPILDTSVAVFSRLNQGKSPFVGGRDHISHRLLNFGFSRRRVIFIIVFLTSAFATIAILLNVSNQHIMLLDTLGIVLWLILFFCFLKIETVNI